MALIKVKTPEKLDSAFRRAASRKIGLRKGAIKDAALAALSKYAGIDPEVSISASSTSIIVEAPLSTMPRVLAKILPRSTIRITTRKDERYVSEKIGNVKFLYKEESYSYFEWDEPDASKLSDLRSFRAEWDGRDVVFEEDCLNVTVDGLEESLRLARSLAPVLGLTFPDEKVNERLDIYKWEGASTQETMVT